VEALSGFLSVALLNRFGAGLHGAIYLVVVWGLVAASFIDLEHQIIPDEISVGGLIVGLVISVVVPRLHETTNAFAAFGRACVGALVGGGLLYVTGALGNCALAWLRRLGVRLRRNPFWRKKLARYRHMKEAMGGGDVKLLAAVGAWTGALGAFDCLMLASFAGAAYGVALLARGRFRRYDPIPFGPFLCAASIFNLFYILPFGFPFIAP
jgi:leader peptidase (prepilin peptidase)/N-methyltransferase